MVFHKLKGSFPASVKLEGNRVFENEISIWNIKKIDSLFVLSTFQDPRIHVYNQDKQLIASFGKKGKGPREFLDPPAYFQTVVKDSAMYLFAPKSNLNHLMKINLSASIDSNQTIVDTVYKLPPKLASAMHIFYVSSSTLIGDYAQGISKQLEGKRRGIFYYNLESKKIKTTPQFILNTNKHRPAFNINLNVRTVAISPDRTRLATILHYYPDLEVLKIDSTIETRYLLNSNPPSSVFNEEDFRKKRLKQYYQSVYVTNNNIYLLYSGAKEKSIYNTPMHIRVLDWKGHPKAQYLIPAKYKLSEIAIVDINNKCFYGISFPNDVIYRFNYGSATTRK